MDAEGNTLHRKEMRTAADAALQSYLEDHPDLDTTALDINIEELVETSQWWF